MRVKLLLAYDGGYFHGFQKQTKTKDTVVGHIESALHALHIHTAIVGSGRTDAGVHATGQVIHIDLPDFWSDLVKLRLELNKKLHHISIKHISQVDDTFHARFSARKRVYRYIIKQTPPSIFEANYAAHFPKFDPLLLRQALYSFQGEHNFVFFHKSGSQMHGTERRIFRTYSRQKGDYTILYFEANGFLRGQVRMMVAAVMECATGDLTLPMLYEQIEGIKRHTTHSAPACGLYLARIYY